jgi:predicted amidohydrolase YtcJ
MACGVLRDELIVRVGPERYQESMADPHTRVFDTTGRVMKGWVMVDSGGHAARESLEEWVRLGVDFALTLPAK